MTCIEMAQKVFDSKTAEEFDGVLLDITTANCMLTVHRELSPENQAKLEGLELVKAANICWKLVR